MIKARKKESNGRDGTDTFLNICRACPRGDLGVNDRQNHRPKVNRERYVNMFVEIFEKVISSAVQSNCEKQIKSKSKSLSSTS